IVFLKENAIDVVMVTGDNKAITTEIARILEIPGKEVIDKKTLEKIGWENINADLYHKAKAFAEILPEDKLQLVKIAKKYFTVATNGDGVNDLPAIKEANVGFAVANAVSSLKATADIVLLANGISVIKDAIIEGRKIFHRLYSYSVYRISESFRLIITIVLLGLLYKAYPLTPLQIIIIALLNDVPIISLAFDRVKVTNRPAKINVTERFVLSTLYGATGIANSIILFLIMVYIFHLSWPVIQTIYFLKLTVSGHMLIYVARTKERWFKFMPSSQVIWATSITQIFATIIALTGFFMPAKIPFIWVVIVWIWSFFWMQIAEIAKNFQSKFSIPLPVTDHN
ncbi:MAG TPA: HAD-IC family P-type ATPase, partial [Patescibacteria group bacterium]